MKKFLVIAISFALFSYTYTKVSNKQSKSEYSVGNIPEEDSFNKLSEIEKEIDKRDKKNSLRIPDSVIVIDGQKVNLRDLAPTTPNANNRSRFFFDSTKSSDKKSKKQDWVEGLCTCELKNDTIYISTAIGFFGGMGLNTKIYKNYFDTESTLWVDDVTPFKANLSDSFSNSISVKSKKQELIFKTKPKFKVGEILFGKLNVTSENYYENKGDTVDSTQNIKSKVLFKCQVIKYINEELLEKWLSL